VDVSVDISGIEVAAVLGAPMPAYDRTFAWSPDGVASPSALGSARVVATRPTTSGRRFRTQVLIPTGCVPECLDPDATSTSATVGNFTTETWA